MRTSSPGVSPRPRVWDRITPPLYPATKAIRNGALCGSPHVVRSGAWLAEGSPSTRSGWPLRLRCPWRVASGPSWNRLPATESTGWLRQWRRAPWWVTTRGAESFECWVPGADPSGAPAPISPTWAGLVTEAPPPRANGFLHAGSVGPLERAAGHSSAGSHDRGLGTVGAGFPGALPRSGVSWHLAFFVA